MNIFLDDLEKALQDALALAKSDAAMMSAITRHAPLDPQNQSQHDTTEYPSERLVKTLPDLLAKVALLKEAQAGLLVPVAQVSEIHMSRYTLEWLGAPPLPQGTTLYASSKATSI